MPLGVTVNSVVLEVAIGLVVVFVLTATVASAVNEVVSRSLNMRSKALWARLAELMDTDQGRDSLGYPFIVKGIAARRPTHKEAPAGDDDALERLANVGSIHALDYVKAGRKSKVWKIPGQVFASALVELAEAKQSTTGLEGRIVALAQDYDGTPLGSFLKGPGVELAGDADRFTDGVAGWFDGQMSVLSTTYRRNARLVLAGLGLVIAVVFNLNVIAVGQELAHNAALRQSAGVLAGQLAASAFEECAEKVGEEQYACAADQVALFQDAGVVIPLQDGYGTQWRAAWGEGAPGLPLHLLGLALTAVAVSFGAPFWFDFLRYLTGVRRARP